MLSRPGDERLTRHGFGAWQAAAKLFLGLARREQEVWSTLQVRYISFDLLSSFACTCVQTLHGLDSVRVINLLSLACLDLEEHALARSLLSSASERIGIALAGSQSIVEDGGEVIAQLAAHIQTTVLLIRLAHPKDEQERTRIETSWWVGAGGTWSALEHLLETAEPADDGSLTVRSCLYYVR